MPGGDRTGPMGMGPMTGRGAGFCAGFPAPGFMNRGFGGARFGRAWLGRGRGGGRGRRNWFYATGLTGWQRAAMGFPGPAPATTVPPPISPEQEIEMLKAQAEAAAEMLDQIRRRMDELESRRGEARG
jgi:hypothetical protein